MFWKLVLSSEQPLSLELYGCFSAGAHQSSPTALNVTAAGKDPAHEGNTKPSVTTLLSSLETCQHKNGIVTVRMGPLIFAILHFCVCVCVILEKEQSPENFSLCKA